VLKGLQAAPAFQAEGGLQSPGDQDVSGVFFEVEVVGEWGDGLDGVSFGKGEKAGLLLAGDVLAIRGDVSQVDVKRVMHGGMIAREPPGMQSRISD
jgi:hypothetical protein